MAAQPISRIDFRHPLALALTGLMVCWAIAALGIYFLAGLSVVWSVILSWLFMSLYTLVAAVLSWPSELADTPGE